MSNEEQRNELLELIKYYQMIIYNYRQYPNYKNYEYSWHEAERRLEYYTEEYAKLINNK